jgi:(4S)-4-hydroxy-5-phosphonooxypentane-2,3-dione isomerase
MSRDPSGPKPIAPTGSPVAYYAITVTFDVAPVAFDQFVQLVHDNAATSLRLEPHCLRFDVLQAHDRSNRRTILLYEIYTDRTAFEAHLETAHFQAFDQATQGMVLAKQVSEFKLLA